MKKVLVCFLILFLLCGCEFNKSKKENKSKENTVSEEDIINKKVDDTMNSLSLEEKIGQMLVLYYMSDTVDEELINTLKTYSPGGFILMKDNITTYDKTLKFVHDLQDNSKIPMIISIDEEGGSVQRLGYISDKDVTDFPYMFDLGKTDDENLAYEMALAMAEELRTIGVNVTYAPVLDIYSNPNNTVIGKRSFGDNSNLVSKMALSFSRGLEDNKVISVFKHFPGHGDTETDSHYSLPVVNKSYEELKENELVPYYEAIKSGAKIIMIGHISLPKITGDNTPASLSSKIITDILKNDMNYQGLVITDALNMGAVTKYYTEEEIYVNAINAGVDLLLMPSGSKSAIEIIKNKISEDRINESVRKILLFKYKYLSEDNYLDASYLGNDKHKEIVNKVS